MLKQVEWALLIGWIIGGFTVLYFFDSNYPILHANGSVVVFELVRAFIASRRKE